MASSPIIDQTRPDQSTNYDLLYDKEFYGESLYVNHFLDKKSAFRVIYDGYILPYTPFNEGGIFDNEGIYINGSSYVEGNHYGFKKSISASNTNLNTLAAEQGINLSETVQNHSTVVFIGIMLKVWGHFITDSMRLLWFTSSQEYRDSFSDCPIAYFPANDFKLEGNHKRLLEILGINTSLMTPVTELTRYDKIILPDESFFISGGTQYFTSGYVETIDRARDFASSHTKSAEPRKIYYSYSKYYRSITSGEDKLEKYFAAKGYDILHPETLSIDEQLDALVNCESFASTVGSSSHNVVFLRDNAEVILIPRANFLTFHQLTTDQVHRLNIHYIDSSFSIFAGGVLGGDPFLYFISSGLRKYFHDEDTESIIYPLDFWKYLRTVFGFRLGRHFGRIGQADRPDTYRYYSTVAAEYFGKLFRKSWPYRLRQWLKKLLKRKKYLTP